MERPQENNPQQPQDYQGSGELFIKRVDYNAKTAEFNTRLNALEKRVKDNDAFAKTFTEAFDNSKKLDKTLVNAVVSLIKTNTQVKSAVKESVGSIDRDWWNSAWKKGLAAAGALAIALVSGLAVYFLKP